jgi:DNA polymerase-3 subunit epsilon
MLSILLSPNFRRKRLLKRLSTGPLHEMYTVPFPTSKSDSREVSFIALDLETTGLNPDKDEILSIGLVGIDRMHIDMTTAQHHLVKPHGAIPEASAVIHHITDDRAASGEPLELILKKVLPILAGKVLIAHHARIEMRFLHQACKHYFGTPFIIPVVDTQVVARRTLERRGNTYRAGELRLPALRKRYGLPHYRLHNALSDALAAAELFLAQLAQYDTGKPITLNNFLLKV